MFKISVSTVKICLMYYHKHIKIHLKEKTDDVTIRELLGSGYPDSKLTICFSSTISGPILWYCMDSVVYNSCVNIVRTAKHLCDCLLNCESFFLKVFLMMS